MAAVQEPGHYNLLDHQTRHIIHLAGKGLDELKPSVKIHPITDSQQGREHISSIKTNLPDEPSQNPYTNTALKCKRSYVASL